MDRSTRIELGLLAPAVAAVLFVVGELFLARPDLLLNPGADPEAFGRMVTGPGFLFYAVRGIIGAVLEMIGVGALYLYLERTPVERLAFWGVLASVLGDVAGVAYFGMMAFVYPRVGALALQDGDSVVAALGVPPVLMGGMFLLTILGLAFLAVAIWRSETLPRWSGVLMLVGFLILPVQVFAVQILGNVLWGLGALWIYLGALRSRTGAGPVSTPGTERA